MLLCRSQVLILAKTCKLQSKLQPKLHPNCSMHKTNGMSSSVVQQSLQSGGKEHAVGKEHIGKLVSPERWMGVLSSSNDARADLRTGSACTDAAGFVLRHCSAASTTCDVAQCV